MSCGGFGKAKSQWFGLLGGHGGFPPFCGGL